METDMMEILLVEDSDEDAELTMRAFKKLRLANKIVRARDGAEALDRLLPPNKDLDHRLRLVLLDLKLPKLSGLEVLECMRADPRTKTVPVVILTSSKEDRDLAAAYELGVNSYIVKPVDFEKFLASVEQLGTYWMLLNEKVPR